MNPALPIFEVAPALSRAIAASHRAVLVAPTGSGKSTQVCQLMLRENLVASGEKIIVLQPRRVAARSLARRVADEMQAALGGLVGYQVRFDRCAGSETRIEFMTEGILLLMLQQDPDLAGVGAILFDEFHERSLLADLALGLCRDLQARRPGLKLVVMSATMQAAHVARYLNCDVIESGGRTYPVDIIYDEWDDDRPVWERAAERASAWLNETHEGDALVFMPGAFEIDACIDAIRRSRTSSGDGRTVMVMPLHGELPPAIQDRVFAPSPRSRRIVVATNVAETSLTIPGITCVIDGGYARVARFDPLRGMNTLRLERISQASADQRAGRAGRLAAGACHRLWSEPTQRKLPAVLAPEVQRADLCEAVLTLAGSGIRDARRFAWLDAPADSAMQTALATLAMLGAIEDSGAISPLGRQMLDFPVHPRHARMLLLARELACLPQVACFIAAISGRDLFLRIDRNDRVTQRNREDCIADSATDIALICTVMARLRAADFAPDVCRKFGINRAAALEAERACQQLLQLGSSTNARPGDGKADWDAARRCHLAGYVDRVAVRISAGSDEFDLADGRRAELRDDSALRTKRAKSTVVVASELREIQQRSGGVLTLLSAVSAIEPAWLRELNPPGLHESVEYAYDRLTKSVVAGRTLRLNGLLVAGERVHALDPDRAAGVLAGEFAHVLLEGKPSPQWPNFTHQLRAFVQEKVEKGGWGEREVAGLLAQAWHGATTVKEAATRQIKFDDQ